MESDSRATVTDSPWFWVLAFSLMAILALAAIGSKYGRRQTRLELQYQARDRVAEQQANANNPEVAERNDDQASPRELASPGKNLIPLWPLAIVLLLIAALATVMLNRSCRRPGLPGATFQK